MNRTTAKPIQIFSALATLALLNTTGCTLPRALEPIDWTDKDVERYAVTGAGSWARFRNQPLIIGEFTATPETKQSWSSLPTETTSDLQVGIGGEGGRQWQSGTATRHNESELRFQLANATTQLANIHCRELLHIESNESSLTRSNGTNSFSMSEIVDYRASVNCRAKDLNEAWPQWQLDLDSTEPGPLQGTLAIDNTLFEIAGSRSSSIGQLPQTVSYEIRRGDHVLALIDRSGDGQLSVLHPVGEKQQLAFLGAAAVLFLANDPVEQ